MRVIDDAVLAAMRATNVNVYDSYMGVAEADNVVTYPLPYAVYYSSVGSTHGRRLDGRTSRLSMFFSVTYVGLDRNQAKWAGEKIRAALESVRLDVPGHNSYLVELLESQRIRRDDDAVRPDGSPLFYGVDNYSAAVTRVRT